MTQRPPATGTGGILANRISIIKDRERNNIPDWVEEQAAEQEETEGTENCPQKP